jgi:integration host factor subunit beta
MTRDELIERVARRTKMSRPQAETLVCAIFDSMERSLRQGERIEIRGFGTFQVRSYKGYQGRNPKTGTPVEVPAKRLPFFKVSKNLAADVNGGGEKKLGKVHNNDFPSLDVASM